MSKFHYVHENAECVKLRQSAGASHPFFRKEPQTRTARMACSFQHADHPTRAIVKTRRRFTYRNAGLGA
jgi:hypothetical protein